jgi:hypothetical protein
MSFLSPFFLLGCLAIAVPFWLHRLQAQSSERQPFSSAMLLETAEEQVHVRRKLKYLLLLALRVALLLLIALAFAKPFLSGPPDLLTPAASGTHLIVIDTSASMSREGAFDQAISLARDAIDEAPGDALLQLFSSASDTRVESNLSADTGTHIAALSRLSAGTQRLDFGMAMAALDQIAESLPAPVTLHMVSDFQASGMPARFSDLATTHIASFVAHRVEFAEMSNRSIEFIRSNDNGIDTGVARNAQSGSAARLELMLNGQSAGQQALPDQDLSVLRFDGLPLESGDNRVLARIDDNDEYAADNRRFHVIENPEPAPVPLLTADIDGLPVTYLSAALRSDPAGNFVVEPMSMDQFDARILSRYHWIVIDDLGSVGAELGIAIATWVREGGNLLAFAGSQISTLDRVPVSGHLIKPVASASSGGGFLTVGRYDAKHPVLANTEGWHNVRLSTSVPIEALDNDEVLIRLENDQPLLVEQTFGNGRMLIMAAGLENRRNDLPTRPVFVSFAVEAARYLSGTSNIAKSFVSGDWLSLALAGGTSGQLIDPDGETLSSLTDTTRAQRILLDKPGFYEVYNSQGGYVVAVNVDPRESQMQAIDANAIDNWARTMSAATGSASAATPATEAATVELWPWLLLMLLLVLSGESMLGNSYLSPLAKVR